MNTKPSWWCWWMLSSSRGTSAPAQPSHSHLLISSPSMSFSAPIFPSSASSYPLVLGDADQSLLNTKSSTHHPQWITWLLRVSTWPCLLPVTGLFRPLTVSNSHITQSHIWHTTLLNLDLLIPPQLVLLLLLLGSSDLLRELQASQGLLGTW